MDIAFQTRRLERTFNSEMIAAANQYDPDYAVPPGWVLEEEIEARGISQAEFARLCGLSAKLISEIIAGKAPIEPETAVQFDRYWEEARTFGFVWSRLIVSGYHNKRKDY